MPHYGDEWKKIYDEVLNLSRSIFKTDGEVLLLPTAGSQAIEASVVNLVSPKAKVLVGVNGFFGERVLKIARAHGREVVVLEKDYGDVILAEDLEKILMKNEDIEAALMIYSETSTGVLNPIKTYGKILRERDILFIVDAISAYGGVELRMDEWEVDYCVGYPSKALGGLPGVIPVAISKRAWRMIDERGWSPQAWFLDFKVWKECIEEWGPWGHPYPTTMPTHTVIALREALRRVLEEGLENVYRRHRLIASAFRRAVKTMGLKLIAPEDHASPTVTAIRIPQDFSGKLREVMLKKFDVMIAGGLGRLAGKIVRVGHMGYTAAERYISITIAAMAYALRELGFRADFFKALRAFYEALGH